MNIQETDYSKIKTKSPFSGVMPVIVLVMLLLILTTCKKKAEDPPPTNDSFVIAPTAKFIVDNDWQSMVKSIDSTNYTLTFDNVLLSKYSLAQGDLMVSSVGNGLLRKIESITQSGTNVQIQTSQATLVDLIKQGDIDFKTSLSISRIKSIQYNYPGIYLDTVIDKSTDGTLFNWDIDTEIAPQIRLQGSFQYTSDFIFQIQIEILEGLKKVKFGFEGTEEFNLAMVAGKQFNFSKQLTLATVYFLPIFIPIPVPPFTIVVAPVLDIKLGLDGYANANITTSLSQNFNIETGIQYLKGSGWSSYLNYEKSFNYTPPQLNVNAGAEAYLKPELRMLIFNLVGPYVNAKGYGRIEADLTQNPWWKMYYGFKMSAGVKAVILDILLFDFSVEDLLKWEQQVGQSTSGAIPTVTTSPITNITETSATGGGIVTEQGSSSVTARGVCWSASSNPTISDAHTTDGTGIGNYTSNITGLAANTPYYVRAYATNSEGTAYGNQVSFTTAGSGTLPTVSSNAVTDITQTGATSGGNVTAQGSSSVTMRGVCWSISSNPTTLDAHTTDGNGIGNYTSNITGLTANTPYFVRAYATNSTGTAYGNQMSFNTTGSGTVPTVSTMPITNITETSATGGGIVTEQGSSPVTMRGICWSISSNPTTLDAHTTDGNEIGIYTSNITGLTANTSYFVRAYATNSAGTAYGNQVGFTTIGGSVGQPCPGTPTVVYGGQTYNTVQIGTQCWLKENLNIGTKIPGTQEQVNNGIIEKYCYDNDEANCAIYGGLYQWNEMMQYITTPGVKGICPTGWHVPTYGEWTTLTTFLGGESVAGGKMKSTSGWYNNGNGTNNSGFTALPGGHWNSSGYFNSYTYMALFYSSSQNGATHAWNWQLYYGDEGGHYTYIEKTFGLSSRCVRD